LFFLSSEVMTGTSTDVVKVTRQILNRTVSHRTIPKQECMVELAGLPLVLCTEVMETVNLSGSYKISSDTHKDFISQYRKESKTNPDMSLHEFVVSAINKKAYKVKKKYSSEKRVIPHYVGANGVPKHPPTKEYAMSVLIVHKPWENGMPKRRRDANEWIEEFLSFVQSAACPKFVKLEYARVKERAESKRPVEVVGAEECYDYETQADVDEETKDILSIVSTQTKENDPFFSVNEHKVDRGLNYDWSERQEVSERK